MTNRLPKMFVQSAVMAIVLPTAAFAELTALEVWDKWKNLAESVGQTITVGSQSTNGDTLILNDITMTTEFPDGNASSTLEFLEFRERNDGTVAITIAPDFPFSFSTNSDNTEAIDFAMIIRQTGTNIIASGDSENIDLDYLASDISLSVDKLYVDGEEIDLKFEFSMNDIDGQYSLITGDTNTYSSNFSAGILTYDVRFSDPDEGGGFVATGSMRDLQSNSLTSLPDEMDFSDPLALYKGDFSVSGGFSTGQTESTIEVEDADGNFSAVTSGDGSELNFSIQNGSVAYGGSARGVQYTVRAPQIPFADLSFGFSEIAFNLLMPLAQSNDPQDFAFLIRLAGFEIGDMVWNMFDPGEIMPRDPATISIDVTGQLNLLLDIFDPELADNFDGEMPAELHNLQINNITLSAAGAEITGTGDFTFDNSDLETFDGFPAPTGVVDMSIIGINGLMDRLIQMGFLQQDQAMGARMMLGLFTRPGNGQDTLTSTIEVTPDGSVFANGQQIR